MCEEPAVNGRDPFSHTKMGFSIDPRKPPHEETPPTTEKKPFFLPP